MSATRSNTRLQYLVLGVLSLAAIVLTATSTRFSGRPFQRYMGTVNPLLVLGAVTVAGFLALGFLRSRGWFVIFSRDASWRGIAMSVVIATVFALIVIPADYVIRFPQEMNVPPPQSFFFYPAIGFVVEVVFHAVPLALLLALLSLHRKSPSQRTLLWTCVLLVSVLEPILQLYLGYAGAPFSGEQVFVGLHLLAFNLVQLTIFRRYDFVSMYALRLVYYGYWHIVWGQVRLDWLF